MKGFKQANVYVFGKGIIKTDLAIENGKIVEIGENLAIDSSFDVGDATVVPGFIDQHIHGAMGSDAMDGETSALLNVSSSISSEGTVAFLATTMTQSPQNIEKALASAGEYIACHNDNNGAELLGVHLEGPFISKKHVGAQPLEYVAKPDVDVFKRYQAISGNNIKIVTLAPEVEGGEQLIEYLQKENVVASVGHSDSNYKNVENAIKVGLKQITHTYNAQTPLHHREVGVVGSAMLFDELSCEVICDTIHVSVPAIKLLLKNKPHDKVILITDAMRAKNMPDGISELGGQTVIVKNGEARLENGTLAGSVLKMNVAIKNLVEKCGVDLCSAVDFASINPAKNLNVDGELGSIEVGKRASFVVLDKDFSVIMTIRDGKVIYEKA